ncbi:receptor-like protein EIX2 [Cryptomeria japonica]|uniref:receptor-like protein EIX2 n=1 Tax=Cryptomeria japonica TaxID=3369 RepID=UPI0027DAABDE|nr:receptor-like protein EIX2 [Cryptomeria japonica]
MAPIAKLFLFTIITLFLLPFCCGCIHRERDALLQLKDALNYSSDIYSYTYSLHFTNLSSWEKGGDCCLWDGISCHHTTRHVVGVEIYSDFGTEGDDIFGINSNVGIKGGVISESLCTLTSLATISLSNMGLIGTIPPCLGKLSSLKSLLLYYNRLRGNIPVSSSLSVLDLADNNFEGEAMLSAICMLNNLSVVDLSDNKLNGNLPSCMGSLSSLTELHLYSNSLTGSIPVSSSLVVLDLADNNFEGETVLSAICMLNNLRVVDLSDNELNGNLPSCLGSLSSLTELYLNSNSLTGKIPVSSSLAVLDLADNNFEGETVLSAICMLSNLSWVDLSYNELNGSLPSCLGSLSSLTELYLNSNSLTRNIALPSSVAVLDLSYNNFEGETLLSAICMLSNLSWVDLSYNELNGSLPSCLGSLSSLIRLEISGNHLSALPSSLEDLALSLDHQQIISEAFFHNLSKLQVLDLSNCVLNISTTWIPSFQLLSLSLTSCKVDGQIPLWISTQFSLLKLDLPDNDLSGEVPLWLLEMSLLFINLTTNHLQGRLLLNTSARNPLGVLDMSRNALSGQIPSIWPANITVLLLNDNFLTGNIPPQLEGVSSLEIINLANNHLNGIIPPSLANCSKLQMLNLADNNLRGRIPYEFGKLIELKVLLVKNNQLNGSFPTSISNCTKLYFLDVGQNLFSGDIPKSIGNISELKVLAMRKNNFQGNIPLEIGQLNNLQILDLSSNCLSGLTPHNIFSLQAMMIETHQEFSKVDLLLSSGTYSAIYTYKNGLTMNSKGRDEHYTYIFPTMASIDLSENQLNGYLPSDLGKLKGLKLLNLSMNNFNGAIPNSIVQLTWLESLDLSTNNFSGQIPPDLGSLSYLGALNFSNNNFSGSIPQGGHMTTFNESSYSGNQNLRGCPLPKGCSWPEFAPSPPPISTFINEEQNGESVGYDIGVGLSYVVGFTTVLKERSHNKMVDLLANIALRPEDISFAGILKIGVQMRPSVPNNIESWQVFNDDDDILKFLHCVNEYENSAFVQTIDDKETIFGKEDDLTTYSKKESDHYGHLEKIFDRAVEYGISLKPKKCAFGVTVGKLLGHIVSKDGIRIDPKRNLEGFEQPIAFFSKSLQDAKIKYDLNEKKAYALVKVVKAFRSYLMGATLVAYVPSAEIKDISTQEEVSGRRCRWTNRIQEFNIDIQINKLVRGQGLAKLMAQSNLDANQINIVEEEHRAYVCAIDGCDWYDDIIYYLQKRKCPEDMAENKRRTLKLHAIKYAIVNGKLLWRNSDGVMQECVDQDQAQRL